MLSSLTLPPLRDIFVSDQRQIVKSENRQKSLEKVESLHKQRFLPRRMTTNSPERYEILSPVFDHGVESRWEQTLQQLVR